jgi:hypothetical protein
MGSLARDARPDDVWLEEQNMSSALGSDSIEPQGGDGEGSCLMQCETFHLAVRTRPLPQISDQQIRPVNGSLRGQSRLSADLTPGNPMLDYQIPQHSAMHESRATETDHQQSALLLCTQTHTDNAPSVSDLAAGHESANTHAAHSAATLNYPDTFIPPHNNAPASPSDDEGYGEGNEESVFAELNMRSEAEEEWLDTERGEHVGMEGFLGHGERVAGLSSWGEQRRRVVSSR